VATATEKDSSDDTGSVVDDTGDANNVEADASHVNADDTGSVADDTGDANNVETSTIPIPSAKMSSSSIKSLLHTPSDALSRSRLTSRTHSVKSLLHTPSDALSRSRLTSRSHSMKSLLHTPSDSVPPSGLRSRSSSMESLFHAPSDALPSSGLDFLLEIHLRRANTDEKAQKMTMKERTMIREGARKERNMSNEEASKIVDEEC
jgi:hypothetical protein